VNSIDFKSLGGMGYAYFHKGDSKKAAEAGRAILEYGRRHSNIRSMVMGHFVIGLSYFVNGDFPSANEAGKKGVQAAVDPFYSQFPRFLLGGSYARSGQYQEAEERLKPSPLLAVTVAVIFSGPQPTRCWG
jgi:tetratricopeptide (TPR) repeat protein